MATAVNPSPLAGISIGQELNSVVERLRRSTVRVVCSANAQGSGVIWNHKGLIITNAHVANSQEQTVEFADGRTCCGWLVGREPKIDLAALAVDATGLPALPLRAARSMRPGELVLAVGNPLGEVGAASTGIVHRVAGSRWVISDIRLAPGNSGGPLADVNGNVIGINSMVVDGMGYSITSELVEQFLRRVNLAEAV